jgi:4'-phosphopantetheinyl transferase
MWHPVFHSILSLTTRDIHVYRASLDTGDIEAFFLTLSDDERARAERFRFDIDRQRFIGRRGILRQLLSRYLQIAPSQVVFAYTSHNKPYLPDHALHFNLSDAKHLALYAFAYAPIGIDVEDVHTMSDMDDVAALMFSPVENAVYRALPDAEKAEGFFNCWTRKEAFIKAIGEGLSYPLADFDVTLKPNEPATILRIHDDTRAADHWMLCDLAPEKGFRAALAVQGHDWQIRCFRWS